MNRGNLRKRCCVLLVTCLFLGTALLYQSHARQPQIMVDDIPYDGPLYMQNNMIYIPMRNFLTSLHWTVEWNQAQRTAVAKKGNDTLTMHHKDCTLTVRGDTLPVSCVTRNNTIYLPLRTLCAMMGYHVTWQAEQYAAVLSTDPEGKSFNAEDIYWLSHIICAEAGGEPLEGQVAVGNVVLNRVNSPQFPNTIYDVIFDSYDGIQQFEPVSNGTVYHDPTSTSLRAARLALEGVNTADGSMYFFNPSLSQGTWTVANCTYLKTIGCHRFYM